MEGGYFSNAGVFLVQTLFGLYILAVLLRLLLQWARAEFYNPISQFLVKVTNPTLLPLRRFIPGFGGIDWASVLLLLLLQMLEVALTDLMRFGAVRDFAGLLVFSIAELLALVLTVYLVTILIQVILSWIRPGDYNPLSTLLYQINEPVLGPARRVIPPISGLDLSPLLVLIAIQLVSMLLIAPLSDMGQALS